MTAHPPGYASWTRESQDAFYATQRRPNGNGAEGVAECIIEDFSVADLDDKLIPQRGWIVKDMIPDRTVTLLSGDGGVGKSTLALQLAVAVVTGKEWAGSLAEDVGPALYVSAEDEKDELHRRLFDIANLHGIRLADMAGLRCVSLAERDAVMGAPAGKDRMIRPTVLWQRLEAKIAQYQPRLLVLDNLADVFGGNEISRSETRQFVGILRALAIKHNCAVVLLSHPSLAGMANGSGISGSTAWSGSVRSRLYFESVRGDDGTEHDSDLRVLTVKKANYARTGGEIRLRWVKGCFRLDTPAGGGFDRAATEAMAEEVFLDLLAEFEGNGRDVSAKPCGTYAPMLFAQNPSAKGIKKRAFEAAMNRLFAGKRIAIETVGPPSRQRTRLVPAA